MTSQRLKELRLIWGDSCKSMWVELLAIRHLEAWTKGNYSDLGPQKILTEAIYAPESQGRLKDLTVNRFLDGIDSHLLHVVTNRIVMLSAAFESYFLDFLDLYIKKKPKYWSTATNTMTPEGNKLYGEVRKVRGLRERIEKFSEMAPAKIESLKKHLAALSDLYILRNILAHSAGVCDAMAASRLIIMKFATGERIALSPDDLIVKLAEPCLLIAEGLDEKI